MEEGTSCAAPPRPSLLELHSRMCVYRAQTLASPSALLASKAIPPGFPSRDVSKKKKMAKWQKESPGDIIEWYKKGKPRRVVFFIEVFFQFLKKLAWRAGRGAGRADE